MQHQSLSTNNTVLNKPFQSIEGAFYIPPFYNTYARAELTDQIFNNRKPENLAYICKPLKQPLNESYK